jgi:hypothetical protein
MVLYLPIAIWAYLAANSDGAIDLGTVVLSVLIGAVAMTSALVLLIIQPRLGYPDVDPGPTRPDSMIVQSVRRDDG